VAGVGPVGLGVAFTAPQRSSVGRLGQMRGDPGQLELLDHVPPAGAALQRERGRLAGELLQPTPQVLPAGRGELALPLLAGVDVDPVVGDLPSVHVQPAYDAHRDLLRAPPRWLSTIIRA
jgi:hypothetical protein